MKKISLRLNLKSKKDGKLLSIHPPVSAKENGMMEWPVNLDDWEVISIDRNSEIMIPDILDREWEVFENDEITVMGDEPKRYNVIFKDGMFGIEVDGNDFSNILVDGSFGNNHTRNYHKLIKKSKAHLEKGRFLFIPLAHLNIGGTIDSIQAIILTKS